MKKILIFYGSYGAGHLSAARSIKEYIDNNYKNVKTEMVDCIEYINRLLNKVTTKTYDELSKKAPWAWEKVYTNSQSGPLSKISNTSNKIMSIKLNKLIHEFSPDLIISTHPFSTQMCGILKEKGKINCKIATVLTDYAPHNQWLVHSDFIDYFFVAHYGMKYSLEKAGIPSSKVFATGIPLSTKFLAHYNKEEILKSFDLQPDRKTVLFFAGGSSHYASGNIAEIFEKLSLIPIDTDSEVCEQAIKAMHMGIKNANKFIEENENMEESILNDINGVVKDYDNHLFKLNNLNTKLSKY